MLQVREQEKEEAHPELLHLMMLRDLRHTAVHHRPVGEEQTLNPCRKVFRRRGRMDGGVPWHLGKDEIWPQKSGVQEGPLCNISVSLGIYCLPGGWMWGLSLSIRTCSASLCCRGLGGEQAEGPVTKLHHGPVESFVDHVFNPLDFRF